MLGFTIGRVCGNSMLPRVVPDSFVIASRWHLLLPYRVGQMYYINHVRYGPIVKTLGRIDGENYWFYGESAESVSSEAIGAVTKRDIIGRVIWVIKPKH